MAKKQEWQVGALVTVGFMRGLLVVEKVPSPGNYRPDGYVLQRDGVLYAFIPHHGVMRVQTLDDARDAIRE